MPSEVENEVIHEDQDDVYNKTIDVEVTFNPNDRAQVPRKLYIFADTNIWLQRGDVIDRLVQEEKVVVVVPNKVEQEIRGLKSSENEDTKQRATYAYNELIRLVNDARYQREEQRKIMGQHLDDYIQVKNEFPNRSQADHQIIMSALILQRRGLNVKIATLDNGMNYLCFCNGIELYEVGPRNQSNHN